MKQSLSTVEPIAKATVRVTAEDYRHYVKRANLPLRILLYLLVAASGVVTVATFLQKDANPFFYFSALYSLFLWSVLLLTSCKNESRLLANFHPEHYELHYRFFDYHMEVYSFSEHQDSILHLPYTKIELVWDRGDMLYLQSEGRIYFIRKSDVDTNTEYVWGCLNTQAKAKRKLPAKKGVTFPTPPPAIHPFFDGIMTSVREDTASEAPPKSSNYTPFYTVAPPCFADNEVTGNQEQKHRALHGFGIAFFVLSLVMIPFAIALTDSITLCTDRALLPFLLLLYLPFFGILLTSLILGIVGIVKKVKNLKNVISAAAVGLLMLILFTVGSSAISDLVIQPDEITELEQMLDVSLPDQGALYRYTWGAASGSNISDVQITEYYRLRQEDADAMAAQLQTDLRWQEEPLVSAVPSSVYFDVLEHDGCILYNRTTEGFNELADENRPQTFVLLSYDIQSQTLYVYEYTVVPGLAA